MHFFVTHTKTAPRTKPRSEDNDNTSINIFLWRIELRTIIFALYFHEVSDLLKKKKTTAHVKSLAIRTDWVSFQIILACFALTALLGCYTAHILKK